MRYLWCFFFALNFYCYGQQKLLNGFVSDTLKNPISDATILIKDKNNNINFGLTNQFGKYAIPITFETDSIFIEVRSLGYKTYKKILSIKKEFTHNVILYEKKEELEEIIIESKRSIIQNKDTITYNIGSFLSKEEETLEDVLQKLPGLEVLETGQINYNGKQIEKILIDGEDLASKKYTLLSQNLDASLLKNVQVLRNYDDNPLRKKFNNSERVALNLNIKESKKNVFFGNVTLGIGTKNRYKIKNNLGLLKKRIKGLFFQNYNNIGLSSKNINNTTNVTNFDLEKNNQPFLDTEISKISNFSTRILKDDEAVLNKTANNSLTLSSRITKNTSLRVLTFYDTDMINFENTTSTVFQTTNDFIEIQEDSDGFDKFKNFLNDVEVKFYNSKNIYITFENNSKNTKSSWIENLRTNASNNSNLSNTADSKENYIFNNLRATYQSSKSMIFENYFYQSSSSLEEFFETSNSRFNFESNEPLNQLLKKDNKFLGWKSRLTFKKRLSSINIETVLEKENYYFKNDIISKNKDSTIFANEFNLKSLNRGLKINYLIENKNKSNFQIDFSGVFKTLQYENAINKNYFLPSSKLNYSFNLKKFGRFSISYQYRKELLNTNYFFNGFLLKNYRVINNQIEVIASSNINTIGFSHSLQKLDTGFLSFTVSSLSYFDKSAIFDSQININSTTNLIDFIDRTSFFFFIQNETTQYFSKLKSSFKLKTNFNIFSNFLLLNNSDLEELTNYSFKVNFYGTTYFKKFLNFQFFLKYQRDWSVFQNTRNSINNYFFNISTVHNFNENWLLSVGYNSYILNNNFQNFLSGNLRYNPDKSKFNYSLKLTNIFADDFFNLNQVNDFQSFNSSSRIIPSYIMMSVGYRF